MKRILFILAGVTLLFLTVSCKKGQAEKAPITEEMIQQAFSEGGKVSLNKNLEIEHQLVVPTGSTAILDLKGYRIYNTQDIWDKPTNSWSLISVQGGTLTIKGKGKLDAKERDCYAIDVRDGGSLIIEGGEIIGNISAVYVYKGIADIRGGKFSIKQVTEGTGEAPYKYTVNLLKSAGQDGTASAIISGGSFYMFNPGDSNAGDDGTKFLADGYSVILKDSWYTVVPQRDQE